MKLTSNQLATLNRLACLTQPWNPSGRSSQLILAALGRMGLAQRRDGYPVGWEINTAGRTALSAKEAENG
ncbi:hypothetical protein M5E06_13290 [Azospirillum sp. A1-3]|uniref:hypothetical protein n=1 Tax=Azospirillum sp. A1-3 TaxID=185874 RepID=UPI0020773E97|nr:hypothetical protein [Azospirillum sp. A1-3]MCM8735157.1 hypothetical protein [Azospirillum sp. A1-3]